MISQSTADHLTVVSDRIATSFLNRSGATRAVAHDISKAFGMLVFFSSSSFMEFQVRHSTLSRLNSVIEAFEWIWMGRLHKNIQLMMEAPFLGLHFSCYALITFMMMLSVILLSVLMILLSTLSTIKHLIFGSSNSWPLNLNLTYEALSTEERSSLLISMLEKLNLFHLTGLITLR